MATILEPNPTSNRAVAVQPGQPLRLRADTAWNWFTRTNEGAWSQIGTTTLEVFWTTPTSVTNRLTFDRVEVAIGSGGSPDTSTTRHFDLCEGPPAVLWVTERMGNEALADPPLRPWDGEDDDPPLATPLAMAGSDRSGLGSVLLETVEPGSPAGPGNLIASWRPGVFVDTAGKLGVRTAFTNPLGGLGPFPSIAAWYHGGLYFEHDFGKGRNLALTRVLYEDADGNVAVVRGDGRRNTYRESGGSYTAAAALRNTLTLSGGVYEETTPSGRIYRYSAAGRLQRVVDRLGNPVYYAYDVNDRLQKIDGLPGQGALGLVPYFSYNGSGLLERLVLEDATTPANNRVSYFTYDGNENLLKVIGPESCVTYFEYGTATRVSAVTDPEGYRWYFAYDGDGRVERVLDALGKPTYFAWTPASALATKKDRVEKVTYFRFGPFGSPEYVYNLGTDSDYFRYDGDGNLDWSRTRLGHGWYYQYDSRANRVSVTDPLQARSYFAYDGQDLLRTYVDPLLRATYLDFDGQRNRTKRIDPVFNTTYYEYETTGLLRQKKDRRAQISYFGFDARGNLAKAVTPLGDTTYFAYNTAGERSARVDPLARISYFHYDARGRLSIDLDPTGAPEYWAYDARCNLTEHKDRLLHKTTFSYDGNSSRVWTRDAVASYTYFGYDAEQRLTQQINARSFPAYFAYDTLGRLQRKTDAFFGVTYFGYTVAHELERRVDALGNPTYFRYDPAGRATHEKNGLMNEAYFGFDAAGQRVLARDRRGFSTYFQYDPRGWLRRTETAVGAATYMAFDAEGNQERRVDPRGFTTYFTYDGAGRQTHVKDALNGVSYMGYDRAAQTVLRLDELGYPTYMTYDLAGRAQTTRDRAGLITYFGYDRMGMLTQQTLDYGTAQASTYHLYDWLNRRIRTTDANGSQTYVAYDPVSNVERSVNVRGFATYYTYDRLDRRTHVKDPVHFASTYMGYDPVGNVVLQVDQLGGSSYLTYDRANQQYFSFDAAGARTYFAYDAHGNRVSTQVLFGSTRRSTYFDYDAAGRLLKTTAADGGVTYYQLDLAGNRERLLDPAYPGFAFPTYFVYDGLSRLKCRYNSLLEKTYFEYDARSSLTKQLDPVGRATYMGYDEAARLAYQSSALGEFTYFWYDARGNRTQVRNPRGYSTYFAFDRLGRQTHRTNALWGVSYMGYDVAGNRVLASDELGQSTYLSYDGLDRLTHSKDQAAAVTYLAYDARSSLTLRLDADGRPSYFVYDSAGRLTQQHFKKALASEAANPPSYFVYDEVRNLRIVDDRVGGLGVSYYDYDAVDRLTKKVTSTGALYYSYDLGGRKRTLKDRSFNENYYLYDGGPRVLWEVLNSAYTAYFVHDASGRRTRKLYPVTSGALISYMEYDAVGRASRVKNGFSGVPQTDLRYRYHPGGLVAQITYGDNSHTYFDYDELDRLTREETKNKFSTSTVYGFRYAYDAASNRTNKSKFGPSTEETYYSYNVLNLVTRERVLPSSDTYYRYDSSQRMLEGRTTVAGGQSMYFTHDQLERISAIAFNSTGSPDAARAFFYNGVGERVVVNDSAPTYWLHDGGRLILERNTTGTDQRKVRRNAGALDPTGDVVEMYSLPDAGSSLMYPGADAEGSVRLILNGGQYWTDHFGVPLAESNSGPEVANQRLRWSASTHLKLSLNNQRIYLTSASLYLPWLAELTSLRGPTVLVGAHRQFTGSFASVSFLPLIKPNEEHLFFPGSGTGGDLFPGFGEEEELPFELVPRLVMAREECRVMLQCRWGADPLGRAAGIYHCGWFTRIDSAVETHLGVHVQQGESCWDPTNERFILTGRVVAPRFSSDRGFLELEEDYFEEPVWDSQERRLTRRDACTMARCVRRIAWEYARRGDRPYDLRGQGEPNSTSFLAVVATECSIPIPPTVVPPFQQNQEEGRFVGWHYWTRVGRDWRTSDT